MSYNPKLEAAMTVHHAMEYLKADYRVLSAAYDHGNDAAKWQMINVSDAINILRRLRANTESLDFWLRFKREI